MIQTDLIPAANDLSILADTLVRSNDSIAATEIIAQTVRHANSGASSNQIGLIIAILGLLIFAAHLFTQLFSRRRIPDVLFLIIIGLVIGPIMHWISPESLGNAGSIFSGITLVTILFESGTRLSFSNLKDSFQGAFRLMALNFVVSAIAIWLVAWLILKLDPIISLMLGCILGCTASAVVIPMVRQLRMTEKSAAMLILEAAFGNVFSIVFALALLEAIKSQQVQIGSIIGNIFSSFILATVMGLVGAIFWALILDKVRNIKNSILTTPAFVFIIYGINEWLGFSGAIAALAFGIGLANIDSIYDSLLKRFVKKRPANLNNTERALFSELVLLLKTFFFIYVGISIQLNQWQPIVIGLVISILLFIMRIPTVRFAISNRYGISDKELMFMAAINPRGLTAAVLATQAVNYIPDSETGYFIKNIVFSVILFSIIINSILIPLIEREKHLYSFYLKTLQFVGKIKSSMLRRKNDKSEKRNSRARDLVEETFQSDIINQIIDAQDNPGAINNKVMSSNSDVAD